MGLSGVVQATSERERTDCYTVRDAVFITEQRIPLDNTIDKYDRASSASHFVAYDEARPVGAARLRPTETATGEVEKVAVLAAYRRHGWGTALMQAVETTAREEGLTMLRLKAQAHAIKFYERLGYDRVDSKLLTNSAGTILKRMSKSIE
jgi:predicted GNAT family N-acyltransferase